MDSCFMCIDGRQDLHAVTHLLLFYIHNTHNIQRSPSNTAPSMLPPLSLRVPITRSNAVKLRQVFVKDPSRSKSTTMDVASRTLNSKICRPSVGVKWTGWLEQEVIILLATDPHRAQRIVQQTVLHADLAPTAHQTDLRPGQPNGQIVLPNDLPEGEKYNWDASSSVIV